MIVYRSTVLFFLLFRLSTVLSGQTPAEETVTLEPLTTGAFRWRDAVGNLYAETYRNSYTYTQACVQVWFRSEGTVLTGTMHAVNLKPNFAYQFKLEGLPEDAPASNEALGFSGRWWQQTWLGPSWSAGGNLNNKGSGTFPNPNDVTYMERKDTANADSPTGLHYRYTGYRPLDYFLTDEYGCAVLHFTLDNAYHVLWRTNQRTWSENDGPLKSAVFNPDPDGDPAYDADYPATSVAVFGEWERLPLDQIYLAPGKHTLNFLITEESFHGVDGAYSGTWAHAFRGAFSFSIARPKLTVAIVPTHAGGAEPLGTSAVDCGATINVSILPDAYWDISDLVVAGHSVGAEDEWLLRDIRQDLEVTAHLTPHRTSGGVPHWWLAKHLPASTNDFEAAAIADTDGDGQSAGQEYFAGTDPADANSVFRIERLDRHGGKVDLYWLTPCRDPDLGPFVVERATTPGTFSDATAFLVPPSATGTNFWRDVAPPSNAPAVFYRLKAVAP